jgi:glucokinase
MSILIGDIGGTKARLQLREQGTIIKQSVYPSQSYSGLVPMIQEFFRDADLHDKINKKPDAMCLALAGPVFNQADNQTVTMTNLSWSCNTNTLRHQLAIDNIFFINDLQAAAYGLQEVNDFDVITLQTGNVVENAPKLLIGIGTGFGQSFLVHQEGFSQAFSSEAGHKNFAPSNRFSQDLYHSLCSALANNESTITVESLLSSKGLYKIYRYLCEHTELCPSAVMKDEMESQVPASVITHHAEYHQPLAEKTVGHYVELLGGYAGNAALSCLPTGGIYIMGGVATHILPWLQSSFFIDAFLDKGVMSNLLQEIPIHVVTTDNLGLMGASQIVGKLFGSKKS